MRNKPSAIYSETVLAHNRAPQNFGTLEGATHCGTADNATCGDHIELQLRVSAERIEAAAFRGESCAVTTACASLLTEWLRDQQPSCIAALRARLQGVFDGEESAVDPTPFDVFNELRHHRARQRCALLPFDAAAAALTATTRP